MRPSTPTSRPCRLARALAGTLLLAPLAVLAAPVNVFYFKDVQTSSSAPSGSATPDIVFSTPAAGLNQTSYVQAAETASARESAIAGSANASTTYEAQIAAGRLRARSESEVTGTYGGPIGTGLSTSARQVLRVRDTLSASGGGAGNPVSLTLTLRLDSLLDVFNVPTGANSALCGYGGISLFADVGTTRISTLGRDLCNGADSMTASATFNVTSGQDFDLFLGMEILSQSAIGAGNTIGSSVGLNAMNTGLAFLSAGSGITLASVSGYDYKQPGGGGDPGGGGGTVPEPATLALVGLALIGLPALRRRAPRAATFKSA